MAGNNRLANEEIRQITQFLNANGITERDPKTEGWYNLMVQNDVGTALITVLQNENIIEYCQETYGGNRVPAYDRVLHAFTLVRPEEVKVLVIGTSPAIAVGKAGGVAFSKPGRRDPGAGRNQDDSAVKKFRNALEDGLGNDREILRGMGLDEYSFDLKYWARENKVLLLNAGLTMTEDYDDGENAEDIKENCKLWRPFMKKLLKAWRESRIESNQQLQTADNSLDKLADKTKQLSIGEKIGPSKTRCNKVHVLLLGYKHPNYENSVHYSKQVWDLPEETNDETFIVYGNVHHPTYPTGAPNNFEGDAPGFFRAAFPQ